MVKIGRAANAESRVKDLQVGCPFKLRIMATLECQDRNDAVATEKRLHARFDQFRHRGEWFYLTTQLYDEIKNLVSGRPGSFIDPVKPERKKRRTSPAWSKIRFREDVLGEELRNLAVAEAIAKGLHKDPNFSIEKIESPWA